jgi:hypothetical protein
MTAGLLLAAAGSGAKTDIEAATKQLEFALFMENRMQLK